MDINNSNKLIAEFMSWSKSDHYIDDVHFYTPYGKGTIDNTIPADMEFHSCWSWLMPVVEKIESLGHGVTIYKNGCHINEVGLYSVNGFNHSSKIEQTYKAVVEFIEWYSETSKKE